MINERNKCRRTPFYTYSGHFGRTRKRNRGPKNGDGVFYNRETSTLIRTSVGWCIIFLHVRARSHAYRDLRNGWTRQRPILQVSCLFDARIFTATSGALFSTFSQWKLVMWAVHCRKTLSHTKKRMREILGSGCDELVPSWIYSIAIWFIAYWKWTGALAFF